MSVKDYKIEIKVKNNWLLKKIQEEGYETVSEFARKFKLQPARVTSYVTFKSAPKNKNGNWSPSFLKISDALRCLPEDICPPQHRQNALAKNKSSFEADIPDVAIYISGSQECSLPAIDHILDREKNELISQAISNNLTPREEEIIRMRFGLTPDGIEHTRKEIAEKFNLSQAGIGHLEEKSLRILRHKLVANQLIEYVDLSRYYYPDRKGRHYVPEWKKDLKEENMSSEEKVVDIVDDRERTIMRALEIVDLVNAYARVEA